jgi:hypothetical protein
MTTEYGSIKQRLRAAASKDPVDSVLVTVLGGALLFFYAERGHNPKVKSYLDALIYVSTCVSVGYADIFPKTPTGKAIASALMAFGPAIAAAALDPLAAERAPEPADPKLLEVQRLICDKLDAVIGELRSAKTVA